MRWSQLKKRIEGNFSEKVKGRVEIWETRYRRAHDEEGEVWVTVDGERVLSCGSLSYYKRLRELAEQNRHKGTSPLGADAAASPELEKDELASHRNISADQISYLSMSIEEVMDSANPVVRGLGILDKRFGVRRLRRLDISREHQFVVMMFKLRCSVEGLAIESNVRSELLRA